MREFIEKKCNSKTWLHLEVIDHFDKGMGFGLQGMINHEGTRKYLGKLVEDRVIVKVCLCKFIPPSPVIRAALLLVLQSQSQCVQSFKCPVFNRLEFGTRKGLLIKTRC